MLFWQQADEGERLIDLIIWPQSRSAVEAFFPAHETPFL
jgi:hypothetical protein